MANITLTGTIVDSDSQAWANASVIAILTGYASPQGLPVRISDGSQVAPVVLAYLDDDGALDLSLTPNNDIFPPNTQWGFIIQPNATVPPTNVSCQSLSEDTDVSDWWNSLITAPRILSGAGMRAYNATEILGANLGDIYVCTDPANLGSNIWNGTEWVSIGSGSGGFSVSGTPSNDSNVPVYNGGSYETATWRQLTQSDILPAFAVTGFSGGQTVEIGSLIVDPTFGFSYTATPDSATLTNSDGVDSPYDLNSPYDSATLTGDFEQDSQASTTFTITASKAGSSDASANQYFTWLPRQFCGVGTAGATGATADGNNADLEDATGTLDDAGLTSNPVGTNYGTQSPSDQKVYVLTLGGTREFKDAFTGFAFAMNAPTEIGFTNQNGVTLVMFLYESSNTLTGDYQPECIA